MAKVKFVSSISETSRAHYVRIPNRVWEERAKKLKRARVMVTLDDDVGEF